MKIKYAVMSNGYSYFILQSQSLFHHMREAFQHTSSSLRSAYKTVLVCICYAGICLVEMNWMKDTGTQEINREIYLYWKISLSLRLTEAFDRSLFQIDAYNHSKFEKMSYIIVTFIPV